MQVNRANAGKPESWVEVVVEQAGSLRCGVVQVVPHDSRVAQIERTEKVRLAGRGGAVRKRRKAVFTRAQISF